jgi:hypothetical protein
LLRRDTDDDHKEVKYNDSVAHCEKALGVGVFVQKYMGSKNSKDSLMWAVDQVCGVSVGTIRKNDGWRIKSSVLRLPAPQTGETKPSQKYQTYISADDQARATRSDTVLYSQWTPAQIELSYMHHGQAFRLLAVEKWHVRSADRTRDLEDEPEPGGPRKHIPGVQLRN